MDHEHARRIKLIILFGRGLVILGLCIVIYFGVGLLYSYQEVRFVRQHHFALGNPDTSSVRSWMSVKYVANAYRIPEEYLFTSIGIPMTPQNRLLSFRILNVRYRTSSADTVVALLEKVRIAIDRFKAQSPDLQLRQGSGILLRQTHG